MVTPLGGGSNVLVREYQGERHTVTVVAGGYLGVSDRKELETYWKDMPSTFMGFDVKLHTAYRPFELLEGEGSRRRV